MIYIKIIKRNGKEVDFDVGKIKTAIRKASDATENESLSAEEINDISEYIEFKISKFGRAPNVEEIQNLVEKQIMSTGKFEIAKNYINYRYKRSLARQSNTTDDAILSLIDCTNEEAKQENSNKNPTINSVQRDYMAGEVSRDLTTRVLLPPDIVKAHKEGIIHFHDADYYAQHMHNCFSGDTKFLTDQGLKSFDSFNDGDNVIVYDKDGIKREATVHCYGKQLLQNVIFRKTSSDNDSSSYCAFKCTPDHRWLLKDENVTTALKVGDELYSPKGVRHTGWKVESIKPLGIVGFIRQKYEVWCVEEPVTHSFTLENGVVTGNCDLINLDDMLQNGTVISGTLIEKPHGFSTACNIATQIIAQVASSQYGGQTITLTHLAPFVDVSRQKIKKNVADEEKKTKIKYTDEQRNTIIHTRLMKEIQKGIQTIQYQIVTLLTTNGQAPFVTVFMYLNEARNEQERKDLALIIEETLKQRIQGVKNEKGVWITPAFPKLIYVLEEDNITENSLYYYLTELAAKCTAKRMVPDYISEKVMLKLKGDVFPCMGCVDGNETVTYQYHRQIYSETIREMWEKLNYYFYAKTQPNNKDYYIEPAGVKIYDQKKGFVECYGIIKNHNSKWLKLSLSNGQEFICTPDHPFENENGKIVFAENLTDKDEIEIDTTNEPNVSQIKIKERKTCHVVNIEPFEEEGFSYDVTTESEHFTVSGLYSHNCRSFLTPDRFTDKGVGNIANSQNYKPKKHKYYGRFNQGVVTINLVDVACSSGGDMAKFWEIFDERLDLCHRALICRHNRLMGTVSDAAPILWQHGALARLKKGETIDKLLFDGYSTISLGYAGLYECTKYMTGKSHTDEKGGKEFAISVMQHMNNKCNEWKKEENIDYSIYGTPQNYDSGGAYVVMRNEKFA